MKKLALLVVVFLLSGKFNFAQVAINVDNSAPVPSAMLDVSSTSKGFLPPRVTLAQLSLIENPADGLMVYCTTDGKIYVFIALLNLWKEVSLGPGSVTPPFICGSNIIINHIEGSVAPISKTTTYGTVTNIPGETSKCWITSNLGSDHQATAVNDTTEASAGWYWQFNRKQGYKHNGLTVTPAWMITSINENSNWLVTDDPCNIELGTSWRLPTYTEWYNVDNAGGWTNWNDNWASGLKLHAAGQLNELSYLIGRGWYAYYRASNQSTSTHGWILTFDNRQSQMSYGGKAAGLSVRCLKDL